MTITQAGILHLFRAGTAMADIAAACDCHAEVIQFIVTRVVDEGRWM